MQFSTASRTTDKVCEDMWVRVMISHNGRLFPILSNLLSTMYGNHTIDFRFLNIKSANFRYALNTDMPSVRFFLFTIISAHSRDVSLINTIEWNIPSTCKCYHWDINTIENVIEDFFDCKASKALLTMNCNLVLSIHILLNYSFAFWHIKKCTLCEIKYAAFII